MHIWMLNHYAVPESGSGGVRHAVLARHLREMGHMVTIFASAVPHNTGTAVEIPEGHTFVDQDHNGVRFRYVRTTPYHNTPQRLLNMMSYRANVLRAVADLEQPDAIIGSCVHLHAADAGWQLARRFGVPFIFEVRDVWPETLADIGAIPKWHPVYLYLRALEMRAYRHAERVIALLPGMLPYLERNGVPGNRVWYIPNGIDPALYANVTAAPATDPFIVSFFGAHGPANGLDTAVEAAKILQDDPRSANIRIRLVGDGPSKPGLLQQAESLGLRNIEFLAPVPKKALAPLAQESHAFLFHLRDMQVLRRYGVSANKLFDYLMAARPVIYACHSYNNPIEEAQAGLSVPPQDPRALAEAMVRLQQMPAEDREAMGARGRAWVLEHHDMHKIARRLEAKLQTLSTTETARQPVHVT